MKARRALCELCGEEAALHCASDSAFLCWACDAHVHGANFIVARHARRRLYPECGGSFDDLPVYGPRCPPLPFHCLSCGGDGDGCEDSSSDSESSSACSSSSAVSCVSSSGVSSAESRVATFGVGIAAVRVGGGGSFKAACSADSATDSECDGSGRGRRRMGGRGAARGELDAGTDAVLASWCRQLGLEGIGAAAAASRAFGTAARRVGAAPFRVCAAAAVWFAAKLCTAGAAAPPLLVRLEACSGVPAKLIVVAEARLAGALRRRADGEEEGWAECS